MVNFNIYQMLKRGFIGLFPKKIEKKTDFDVSDMENSSNKLEYREMKLEKFSAKFQYFFTKP